MANENDVTTPIKHVVVIGGADDPFENIAHDNDTVELELDSPATGSIFDDKEAGVLNHKAGVVDQEDINVGNMEMEQQDTMRWFRMSTERVASPNDSMPNAHGQPLSIDQKYENFILHLRHVARYDTISH